MAQRRTVLEFYWPKLPHKVILFGFAMLGNSVFVSNSRVIYRKVVNALERSNISRYLQIDDIKAMKLLLQRL